MRFPAAIAAIILTTSAGAPSALAWDCVGHRAITLLAMDGLAKRTPDLPDWLKSENTRLMAASNACEPDRFRSIRTPGYLAHENNMEHYMDVEDLESFGLTLDTVPPLRNEYLRALIIAKHEHPENAGPYNEKLDPTRSQEWPGFVPHAMMEHYCKLISAFKTERTLEKLGDSARAPQLEAARAHAILELGMLSHVVGDTAQPLHTTCHHHGWVGPNPNGFTTDRKIHAYIDGEVLVVHQLDYEALKGQCRHERTVDGADPWKDAIDHIRRSHDQVLPLYQMHKSGDLDREPGKAFITERLCDGGDMLGAMFAAAWKASEPTDKDIAEFVRYDKWEGVRNQKPDPKAKAAPGVPSMPESAPASGTSAQ